MSEDRNRRHLTPNYRVSRASLDDVRRFRIGNILYGFWDLRWVIFVAVALFVFSWLVSDGTIILVFEPERPRIILP